MDDYRAVLEEIIRAENPRTVAAHYLVLSHCVCNKGAQECPVHLHNLKTKEEKIQTRKDWDERVVL